ncbi:MAG: hypothetical protein OXI86_11315, partial [Candidatus Poribacteria bacterium]|nr:hypothetical protein [Candidatus Poribacteria bacterium]
CWFLIEKNAYVSPFRGFLFVYSIELNLFLFVFSYCATVLKSRFILETGKYTCHWEFQELNRTRPSHGSH